MNSFHKFHNFLIITIINIIRRRTKTTNISHLFISKNNESALKKTTMTTLLIKKYRNVKINFHNNNKFKIIRNRPS